VANGRGVIVRRITLFAVFALTAGALMTGPDGAAGASNASDAADAAAAAAEAAAAAAGPGSLPSIVLINTDDQRPETLNKMPTVQKRLINQGISFPNAFVVNPECCPSRASTFTGLYSHNTGVYRDQPPHGGVKSFVGHGNEKSTIATWLQDGGYTTALMGKYLNGYKGTRVPQGWDDWMAFNVPHSGTGHYFNYDLNINGKLKHYDEKPKDYSTDVLTRKASSFIHNTKGPLFLYWAPSAPHKPSKPAPRYKHALKNLPKWRPKSYNERGIADKPKWAQFNRLSKPERKTIDFTRLQQYRTLLSVDDAVGKIVNALKDAGRLDNTLIIYTSDNGFLWGEHRLDGKQTPWEESIRVPFIFRYDPITANTAQTNPNIVLNIDLAPTFADLGEVNTPHVDGESIFDLLNGDPWRTSFLIEHMEGRYSPAPTYCAMRTDAIMYSVYKTGDRELYDLGKDPLELHNLAKDPDFQDAIDGKGGYNDQLREMCQPPPPNWDGP
jgi:arylsulfatase A-like enzyme